MRVSFCLGATLIPEYLDFHSGYSAPGAELLFLPSSYYFYHHFYNWLIILHLA